MKYEVWTVHQSSIITLVMHCGLEGSVTAGCLDHCSQCMSFGSRLVKQLTVTIDRMAFIWLMDFGFMF